MEFFRNRRIVAVLVVAGLALCSAAAVAEPIAKEPPQRASVTSTGKLPALRVVTPVDPRLQRPEPPPLLEPPPPPTNPEWAEWLKVLGGMILGALH